MVRLRGFINGAYTLPSVAVQNQRCVNLYVEMDESNSLPNGERAYLRSIPGPKPYLTLPNSPVRGLYVTSNGVLFAVGGGHLYEVRATNEIVDRGTLDTTTGRVSMTDNGIQLCVVDGTYGYSLTFSSNLFAKITSGAFYPGNSVDFLDGVALVPRKGTFEYHWSGLYDFQSWNALDYSSASKDPDKLVTVRVFGSNLWCLGESSLEVHQNTGQTFEPINGAQFDIGCASAHSVQVVDELLLWLDSSPNGFGAVWMAKGITPKRVSTQAIEKALQENSDLSGAYSWSYKDGGHAFYCISLPYAHSTWCYDISTDLWHERVSIDGNNREKVSRIGSHAFAYNRHFAGDSTTGALYVLDDNWHFDGTSPLIWKRSSPHINEAGERLFFTQLELDIETGLGLDSGQGSDPVVFMRFSDDRGHSWSDPISRGIGKTGRYKDRVTWNRLGSCRDRVFEFSGSDPVPVRIMGVNLK